MNNNRNRNFFNKQHNQRRSNSRNILKQLDHFSDDSPVNKYQPRRNNRYNRNQRRNYNRKQNNNSMALHVSYLPLYVYIFFAIMGLISTFAIPEMSKAMEDKWRNYKLLFVLILFFKILYGVILYSLCTNGYIKTAWTLVLLPFIMSMLFLVGFIYLMSRYGV